MKKAFLSNIILSLTLLFTLPCYSVAPEIEVFNVGQGNCIIAKVPKMQQNTNEDAEDSRYEYMIVDAGTSGHAKGAGILNALLKQQEELLNLPKKESQKLQSTSTPPSTSKNWTETGAKGEKNIDHSFSQFDLAKSILKKIIGLEEIVEEIEEEETEEGSQIEIHPPFINTIVITHPDSDHCNLLPHFFNQEKLRSLVPKVKNIILGGLPERYLNKKKHDYKSLFNHLLNTGTNIYFVATNQLYEPNFQPSTVLAPLYYDGGSKALPKQNEHLKKAFDFQNPNFKVNVLCMNALHVQDKSVVTRMATDVLSSNEDKFESYSNDDSIVLKISYGDASAILTGDATGIVTQRILASYSDDRDFLKTDILVAAHHGASSHASNHISWIEATQPRAVLISNATNYHHPRSKAYETLKKSPRLCKFIEGPHYIPVASSKKENYKTRTTVRGIFSTLSNGSLRVTFPDLEIEEKESTLALKTDLSYIYKIPLTKDELLLAPSDDEQEEEDIDAWEGLRLVTEEQELENEKNTVEKKKDQLKNIAPKIKELEKEISEVEKQLTSIDSFVREMHVEKESLRDNKKQSRPEQEEKRLKILETMKQGFNKYCDLFFNFTSAQRDQLNKKHEQLELTTFVEIHKRKEEMRKESNSRYDRINKDFQNGLQTLNMNIKELKTPIQD